MGANWFVRAGAARSAMRGHRASAATNPAGRFAPPQAGRIAHLALDVFPEEPLPRDHALARLPNTTLTAHVAWYTREASMRLLRIGLQALSDELAALA